MKLYMVTIIPRGRTADHRIDRRIFDFSNPLQLINEYFSFYNQLFFVRKVLIMATATFPEMFALWDNAFFGWFKNFNDLPTSKILFFFPKPYPYFFPWQPKRDKDRAAIIEASHGIAAICESGQNKLMAYVVFRHYCFAR